MSRFQPATIPTDTVGTFHAVYFTYGDFGPATAALARFTLAVPDYRTARDVDRAIRHVAYDGENGRYFALTAHEFGTIAPSTGRFTKVEVDPSLGDFSWPKGIAFDRTGDLHPPIPVPDGPDTLVQLHESDGKLVLVLPSLPASSARPAGLVEAGSAENRILVVDPASGEVFRPAPSGRQTPMT